MLIVRSILLVAAIVAIITQASADLERPWAGVFLPTSGRMHDVTGWDRYQFYAAGESGTILQSEDGGRGWSPIVQIEGAAAFRSIDSDPSLGVVAVGVGGMVTQFRPGTAPATRTLNPNWDLTSVAMENGVILIAGTDENQRPLILRSTDGGQSFNESVTPVGVLVDLVGIRFLGVTTVVAYGSVQGGEGSGAAMILVSQDAGNTWFESTIGPSQFVVTAIERTALHWVAVGIAGTEAERGLYRSTDEGQTWSFEQHSDMAMITDLVRGVGPELIAVGARVLDSDPEPVMVATEYYSLDRGQNWGIRDIAQTDIPFVRLGRSGDRVFAVGFETDVYRRYYDAEPPVRDLHQVRKFLPLGSINVGSTSERQFMEVVTNQSESSISVTSTTVHGLKGCTVISPLSKSVITPGKPLNIVLAYAPEQSGESWGVLSVAFSNDTILDFLISGYGQEVVGSEAVVANIPLADLGNVVGTEQMQQRFEVVRNAGKVPVLITDVTMTGGDQIVFGWAGDWQTPFTLQPGEVLSIDLMFEPLTAGVFQCLLEVRTPEGAVIVPVVATSRETTWEHTVDLGVTSVGQQVQTNIDFRHSTWNVMLDLVTVNGPSSPFAVVSTSGLPLYNAGPGDPFTVTVGLEGSLPGRFASMISIPWSFEAGASMREDRRVVVGTIGGTTGVDDVGPLSGIDISPQPAIDYVRIDLSEGPLWTELVIMDLQGQVVVREVLSAGQTTTSLNVQNMPSGLYMVVARKATGIVSRPFIQL